MDVDNVDMCTHVQTMELFVGETMSTPRPQEHDGNGSEPGFAARTERDSRETETDADTIRKERGREREKKGMAL